MSAPYSAFRRSTISVGVISLPYLAINRRTHSSLLILPLAIVGGATAVAGAVAVGCFLTPRGMMVPPFNVDGAGSTEHLMALWGHGNELLLGRRVPALQEKASSPPANLTGSLAGVLDPVVHPFESSAASFLARAITA